MYSTPKTNWTKDDYINIDDYNRIKNNLAHLKTLSLELYMSYSTDDMGSDATYSGLPYADMINKLELNLERIATNTYKPNIGATRTFSDYGTFITFTELNRIETAILNIYNNLTGEKRGRQSLSFKLGTKRWGVI
ncbi:MAG: hypothetical protein QM644_18470 [Mobilitalea sp.]